MVDIIHKLARLVNIKDLFFESTEAHRLFSGKPPNEVEIDLSYSADGRIRHANVLDAVVSFIVKVNGLEKAALAKIACKIRITYQIEGSLAGIELNENLASAFARTNGIYNAFPYFREYLQGACGRLGLPPIIAPPVMAMQLFKRLREDMAAEEKSATEEKPSLTLVKREQRASGT